MLKGIVGARILLGRVEVGEELLFVASITAIRTSTKRQLAIVRYDILLEYIKGEARIFKKKICT